MMLVIDVARIEARQLLAVLAQAGHDAEMGPGLSDTGEATVRVRSVRDAPAVKALVREHCGFVRIKEVPD